MFWHPSMSGYLTEPIKPMRTSKVLMHFFKVIGGTQVVLTSHMSGYFLEPVVDIENFKGAVRNKKNNQKGPK